MAALVLPLAQLKLVPGPSPITAEQRYWRSFKSQKSHTFPALGPGAATASHSLVAPAKANDLFAVTSDPRVELFSVRKREPLKTIGRFDSDTYSGDIRPDGRVLVAGEDSGKIQIFGVGGGTRAVVLKTWHVHKQLVWVTHRSPTDLTTLISASNDEFIGTSPWSLVCDARDERPG
ncbi:hypothetical protein B0T26DRAFT_756444 [Lasiosphaeria miniovina]|uniref:Uncharacterized protein n=1 Tax=Lasiosphaeria miniovina TaxID=1954250 RepID=A0AA40A0Z7_9PEZI|nr:uncharacterized protein B0T26DRAFT_756444 [Lasiosphaeria miniovina]KAK0707049.1 hypothetical protein B0T26DRAFT_756444 [Lasiosphaeria miniovina]